MSHFVSRHLVLVPGLWQGGWVWERVTPLLEARGHEVTAITPTGLGERSHLLSNNITISSFVDDVANTLRWRELEDVVLVGHGFGGIAATGAADKVPERIGRLIYLDGALMEDGETWFGLLPYDIVSARIKAAHDKSPGLAVPPAPLERLGVTGSEDKAFLEARMTPHPFNAFTTKLTLKHKAGNGLPVDYIVCTDPIYAPAVSSHDRAREKGWRMTELKAGHMAMVTAPQETADVLNGCARR